jgi:uncharacterized protein
MPGEINLTALLKTMKPVLNNGEYVFCAVAENINIQPNNILFSFREKEGITIIITKTLAHSLQLSYHYISSWITLTIHSSLEAVGLTAAFSKALADENISCNVVAAFYHDHIFVAKKDTEKAMQALQQLSAVS